MTNPMTLILAAAVALAFGAVLFWAGGRVAEAEVQANGAASYSTTTEEIQDALDLPLGPDTVLDRLRRHAAP